MAPEPCPAWPGCEDDEGPCLACTEYRRHLELSGLAGVAAAVLKRNAVGLDENLWEAGLHSLLAARLVTAIHSAFDVDLDIATIYHRQTVRELAEVVFPTSAERLERMPTSEG